MKLTQEEQIWLKEILTESKTLHCCDANEIREYLTKAIVASRRTK